MNTDKYFAMQMFEFGKGFWTEKKPTEPGCYAAMVRGCVRSHPVFLYVVKCFGEIVIHPHGWEGLFWSEPLPPFPPSDEYEEVDEAEDD